jgi:predicted ArsR family transcriptional regulator
MAKRGRKPNVATDVIVQAALSSDSGTVTTADFGGKVTAKRLNDLATEGILVVRKATEKIMDGDQPGRGRPRNVFGLSRKTRDRAKRAARKATA